MEKKRGFEGNRVQKELLPPSNFWGGVLFCAKIAMGGNDSRHLEPDGIDDFAEHEERQDPERAEDGGEEEFQPGPDVAVQGWVTWGQGRDTGGTSNCGTKQLGGAGERDRDSPMICAVTDWRTGINTR